MELSDYELVRYPSGQLVLMKSGTNRPGAPASGPKDVIGAFTNEAEAQSALARLAAAPAQSAACCRPARTARLKTAAAVSASPNWYMSRPA